MAVSGTDGVLSVETMGSFFRNQTFPKNWHRRATPGTFEVVGYFSGDIFLVHPEVSPGARKLRG
jgi:hypothetical protein